jgi:hypothetical protein
MSRFFPSAKRSLDSLLNLITDLVADGLLFFRLLFRSRTALSAEVLFLRKQLAFCEERQAQPRRLNDSACVCLILWSRSLPKIPDGPWRKSYQQTNLKTQPASCSPESHDRNLPMYGCTRPFRRISKAQEDAACTAMDWLFQAARRS